MTTAVMEHAHHIYVNQNACVQRVVHTSTQQSSSVGHTSCFSIIRQEPPQGSISDSHSDHQGGGHHCLQGLQQVPDASYDEHDHLAEQTKCCDLQSAPGILNIVDTSRAMAYYIVTLHVAAEAVPWLAPFSVMIITKTSSSSSDCLFHFKWMNQEKGRVLHFTPCVQEWNQTISYSNTNHYCCWSSWARGRGNNVTSTEAAVETIKGFTPASFV